MTNRHDIKKYRNILLPRFDTFGDIVLLEGFIDALLDFLPDARITILVREGYNQLAPMFPERLRWKTVRLNPYQEPAQIAEIKSLLKDIQNDDYDLLLMTTYSRNWPDELLAASMTSTWRIAIGEPHTIYSKLRELLEELGICFAGHLYDECIFVGEKSPETEKYQIVWKHITDKSEPLSKPQLIIPDDIIVKANEWIAEANLKEGAFAFCCPAGVFNIAIKTWPEEQYAKIIAYLETSHSIVSLIVAHESEKDIVDRVVALAEQKGAHPQILLGRDGDLPFVCALAAKSFFYLGNDTGLMHMSTALHKPVIAIFGGGTWPRFLPCANAGRIFVTLMPCFYCMWDCIWDYPFCIIYLTMEHILPEIDNFLSEISSGKKTYKIIETKINENHPYFVLARTLQNSKTAADKKKLLAANEHYIKVISEQTAAIKAIEKERNRLAIREKDLLAANEHYIQVINEQQSYRSLNQSIKDRIKIIIKALYGRH